MHSLTPPTPVHGLQEWARIVQCPDGTIAGITVRMVENQQYVCGWFSMDNGATWAGPEVLFSLPREYGLWSSPEVLVDRDGEIHVFVLNDLGSGALGNTAGEEAHPEWTPGEVRLDIWHLRSAKGRTEWPAPKRIWTGYTGALNSVVQMRNGRILLPFSYLVNRTWRNRGEGLDAYTFRGTYLSTVIYSEDNGETWQRSPTPLKVPVPDISYAYGAVEPVVLELRDGRVWMLIRTQMGRFYESFSPDGAIWSIPRPTAILSSDSPAGLVRLADGRITLVWNNCLRYPYAYGGRQVIHAAVSTDEGQTWRGYREIGRDPHRGEPPPPHGDFGSGYPYPTALQDGSLLYTTGQGEGRVLIMRLNPDWLCERQLEDNFANGLEDWSVFGTKGVELVSHSGKQLLRIARIDEEFPACAVRNFPAGQSGTLEMRVLLEEGCGKMLVGLADHFSTPFDQEDIFFNLFNLNLAPGENISTDYQHTLTFSWSIPARTCKVQLDRQPIAMLPLLHESPGPSYLRLRSLADRPNCAGMLVESLKVWLE